jgi:hypothetical protein
MASGTKSKCSDEGDRHIRNSNGKEMGENKQACRLDQQTDEAAVRVSAIL